MINKKAENYEIAMTLNGLHQYTQNSQGGITLSETWSQLKMSKESQKVVGFYYF